MCENQANKYVKKFLGIFFVCLSSHAKKQPYGCLCFGAEGGTRSQVKT